MPSRDWNVDEQFVLSMHVAHEYDCDMSELQPPSGFWHRQWHEGWKTVRTAPFPFFVCTLIATGATCTACYWFVDHLYAATLQSDAATLQTVREERDRANRDNDRLSQQVDGLRIYRSNDSVPLKKKALLLAQQIRDFAKDWKDSDPAELKAQNAAKYLNRFGLRASTIRDDLDQNGQQSDAFDKVMFEFKGGYDEVHTIATEIQKLAEKLPD